MSELLVGPGGLATIQAAINAASEGDTILVAAGTYDGAFTVTKGLTIRAADPDAKPEIVGTGTRATIAADSVTLEDLVFDLGDDTTTDGILLIDRGGSWPAYTVEYSDITLSGLEFHGGRRAIYATAEDLTIEHSVFEGQYRDAVFINAAAGDTTISGNAFSGTTGSKAVVFENFSSADPAVSGTITISDNTLTGKGNFVVYNQWQYAPGPAIAELALTITDNVISGTSGAPVSIFDPRPYDSSFDLARFDKFSLLDVSDNTITLSAGEALELPAGIEFTGVVDFDGNEVSGTGDADAPIGTPGDDTILGLAGDDAIAGGDGDDTITGGAGADTIDGGVGIDAAVYAGTLSAGSITASADTDPDTDGNQAGWHVAGGAEGSDTLANVEVVEDAGQGRTLLVGNGGFATIQAAIDAANRGDTILVAAGTYAESITITKGLTLVGLGAVTIDPTSGAAITISGDLEGADVALDNLSITGGTNGIYVAQTANAGTLTVTNSAISGNAQHGIYVIGDDPDNDGDAPIIAGITAIAIIDTGFSDNGLQSNFQGSAHIKLFGFSGDALFENLTIAGAVADTAVASRPDNAIEIVGYANNGNANVPPNAGAPDIGTVVFDGVTITGAFHKNPVAVYNFTGIGGLSIPAGNGGIDLSGAESSWGPLFNIDGIEDSPIDVSGYALTFPDDDAIKTEIQGDKPGQDETSQTITGTADQDALMGKGGNDILNGGGGDDTLYGGDKPGGDLEAETGEDTLHGGEGGDTLVGGKGDDAVDGGAGDDTIVYVLGDGEDTVDGGAGTDSFVVGGTAGDDTITVAVTAGAVTAIDGTTLVGIETIVVNGGGGTDTVSVSGMPLAPAALAAIVDADPTADGDQAGWSLDTGSGAVLLHGIEQVTDGTGNVLLVGSGGYATIQAAVDAAVDGDTIVIAAGTHSGNVTLDKQLTIVGAQWGIDGRDEGRDVAGGSGETTINGLLNILAPGVVVDGLRILDGAKAGGTGSDIPGIFVQAADVTIRNSVFYRAGTTDADLSRAIMTKAGSADGLLVTDNRMAGWHTGIYINGGQASEGVTVSDNAFTGNLVGLSMDAFEGGLAPSIAGNAFTGNLLEGIGIGSIGGAHWDVSGITGNTFTGPGIFNYDPGLSLAGLTGNTLAATDGDDTIAYAIGTGAYAVEGGDGDDGLEVSGTAGVDALGVVLDGAGHVATVAGLTIAGVESVVLDAAGGTDTLDYTGTTVEVSVDLGTGSATGFESITGIENVTGGAGDDTLTGDDGANAVAGGEGSDRLRGGLGVDAVKGGGGDDTIEYTIGDGADTIDGGAHQTGDTLAVSGTAGDDTVDVILTGGVVITIAGMSPAGIEAFTLDALAQGTGGDALSYAGTAGGVSVDLAGGTATGFASIAGVENVTGGDGIDILTGDSGSNTLIGGASGDTLSGGLGDDTVDGGDGDDTIAYTIGEGADAIDGGNDTDTLAVTGTAGDDAVDVVLTAGAITGLEGGTVSGVESATLDALAGDDTLSYAGTAGGVTVSLAGGAATGLAAIAGIENVTGGDGNDGLTGNDAANVLAGGGGDDTLRGGGGADVIDGGAGDDTIHYAIGDGADTIDGGADGVNGDTLAVTGTSGDDTVDVILTGGVITTIAGMTPAGIEAFTLDALAQSTGGDTLSYDGAGSAVAVDLHAGSATGFVSIAGVEKVVGGSGNDSLTGDDAANSLAGGEGDDELAGGLGADTIHGGAGSDTIRYTIGDGADTIDGGGDADTLEVKGTTDSDTIDVVLSSGIVTEFEGVGVAGVETVTLDALGGSGDTLSYAAASSGVAVDLDAGSATGFASITGIENVTGGSDDDTLIGDAGASVLTGGAGDDVLDGGGGNDTAAYAGPLALTDVVAKDGGGWTVTAGAEGTDSLANIKYVQHAGGRYLLVGNGGFATLADAIAHATKVGDTVVFVTAPAAGQDVAVDVPDPGTDINVSLPYDANFTITVQGSHDNTVATGGGDDVIVFSGSGNNFVETGAGNDYVVGGEGNDSIVGGDGAGYDIYDGGDPPDPLPPELDGNTLIYKSTGLGITVDLRAGDRSAQAITFHPDPDNPEHASIGELIDAVVGSGHADDPVGYAEGTEIATDVLINIQNVTGGAGDDTIHGDDDANVLKGGADHDGKATDNADTIHGHGGGDTLTGGTGVDAAYGGAGDDTIVYVAGDGTDTLVDGGEDGETDGDTLAVSGTDGDDTIKVAVSGGAIVKLASNDGDIGEASNVAGIEQVTLDLGQGGSDTIDYSATGSDQAITVGLSTGEATGFETPIAGVANITGGAGDDSLTGDDGANILIGGDGEDTLSGGAADDSLTGGKGADTIHGGDGDDTIHYTVGDGADTIDAGTDATAGDTLVVTGTTGDDSLTVTATATVVTGLAGGTVTGVENGSLDLLAGSDTLSFLGSLDAVTVNLATGAASGFTSIAGVENVTGGAWSDDLTGDDGANILNGGDGGDTLRGGKGSDTIQGGDGNDTIDYTIGDGADTIDAGDGSDGLDIEGTAGEDTIDVVVTSGVITGFEGGTVANVEAVVLDALAGTDTLSYAGTTEAVTVNLATPSATGFSSVAGLENVTGGDGGDKLTGDDGANTLSGGGGADRLIGGKGNDTIQGGAGADTIGYTIGDGTDTIDGGADTDTLAVSGTANSDTIEVVLTAGLITTIAGMTPSNVENFTLDALAGTDTLSYAGTTGAVTVNLATPSATGFSSIAGLENVTGGDGGDKLTGDDGANTLAGGAGADRLTGGKGNDTIQGGAGADTIGYTIGDGTDTIDGGADTDTLAVSGTADADTIDVVLTAGLITTIAGLAPSTVEAFNLDALAGTDTLSYGATSGNVTVNLATALATGFSTIAGIENVTGGNGADTLTGDANANTLIGGAGADTLRGGKGNDTIEGGAGTDTINYTIGDGTDTIDGGADADTLAVSGTSGADTIDVVLTAGLITSIEGMTPTGIEAFTLDALSGSDTLSYAGTAGAVTIDLASLTATGFASIAGVENVTGGSGGDTLAGSGAANSLAGGGGDDVIAGGTGNDTIAGGSGTDTAAYAGDLTAGSIAFVGGKWVVDGGAEGIDTLTGIERVTHGGSGAHLLVGGGGFADRSAAEAVMGTNDVLVFAATPGAITDTDSATNRVGAGAANGSAVGIDAGASTDVAGGAITFSLSDTAGGRFAITAATGVVTVADAALLAADGIASFNVTVRATNGLGAISEQTFAIATGEVPGLFIRGTKANDVLVGASGDDTLIGRKGKDKLDGREGDDLLIGGANKDTLIGGPGRDTASYLTSKPGVKIDLGKIKQKGGAAEGDRLKGIEDVIGSDAHDTLTGNAGDNLLDGRKGRDKLNGKAGTDVLIGGKGKDAFTFKAGYGEDTIADFKAGDTIRIGVEGVGGFKALKGLMSQSERDVVVDFGDGDVLTIAGTSLEGLHKGDFLL